MTGSARIGTARVVSSVIFAAGLAASGGKAVAQTVGTGPVNGSDSHYAEVRTRIAHTDNARRVTDDKEDDTLASVGFDVNYGYSGAHIDASAIGNVDYVEYLDDSYGGSLAGRFDGELVWGKKTDLLQWRLQESFGQARSNALASATPDNLQNVNVLSTGPTVNLRFGDNTVRFDGLYTDQSYESGNFDSDKLTGGLSVGRNVSEKGAVSLNAEIEKTRYDDATNVDYETREYFLSYDTQIGRTGLRADVGYTQIELDDADDSSGGALARLELRRQISASMSLFVSGRMQYSSSADVVRLDARTGQGLTTDQAPLSSADPFKDREIRAGWSYDRSRTSMSVAVTHGTERHEQQILLDRDHTGVEAQFQRHLAPTLWLSAEGQYQKEKFDLIAAESKDLLLSAQLSKDVGRRLTVSLRYEYTDRSGSGGVFSYTENLIAVYFSLLAFGGR